MKVKDVSNFVVWSNKYSSFEGILKYLGFTILTVINGFYNNKSFDGEIDKYFICRLAGSIYQVHIRSNSYCTNEEKFEATLNSTAKLILRLI